MAKALDTNYASLPHMVMVLSSLALASALGFYLHPLLPVVMTSVTESRAWAELHQLSLPLPLLSFLLLNGLVGALYYTTTTVGPGPSMQPAPQFDAAQPLPIASSGYDVDKTLDNDDNQSLREMAETKSESYSLRNAASAPASSTPSPSVALADSKISRRLNRSKSERVHSGTAPPTEPTHRQFSGNSRRVKAVIVADLMGKEEEEEEVGEVHQVDQRAGEFISRYFERNRVELRPSLDS